MAEHLDDPVSDAAAPAAKPGGPAAFRPHDRLVDRRSRRRRLGDGLPQRRLLPAARERARCRRSAAGLRDPHHVLVPARVAPAPAPHRPARVSPAPTAGIGSTPSSPGAGLLNREQLLEGAGATARRLVPRRLRRRRPPGMGNRLSHRSRSEKPTTRRRRLELAKLGKLTPESAPPERADMAHLPAGGDAVGGGRRRRADATGDLARLRQRARALHPAARPAAWPGRRSRSRWRREPSPDGRSSPAAM